VLGAQRVSTLSEAWHGTKFPTRQYLPSLAEGAERSSNLIITVCTSISGEAEKNEQSPCSLANAKAWVPLSELTYC